MKFIKNNFWTFCSLTLVMAMSLCGDAWANGLVTGSTIMGEAANKVQNVFDSVKTITFILGGFGLVGVAYSAIIGKINWKWFAGLAVGLAILGAAGSIVQYATGDTSVDIGTSFGNV